MSAPGRRPIGLALRAYPAWWRDRYGPELLRLDEDLVEAGGSPLLLAIDVARAGLRVRLTGAGLPPIPSLWATRSKWLLTASGVPTVLGTLAGLSALSRWYGFETGRIGTAEQIASGLWLTALVGTVAVIACTLASWRLVLDGVRSVPPRGRGRMTAALFLPPIVLVLEVVLDWARSSLGSYVAFRPRGVRRVDGVTRHYVVTAVVSRHPALTDLLTTLAYLVGYGGLVLFLIALCVGIRQVPAGRPSMAGGVALVRWTAIAGATATLSAGLAGALIVRATVSPRYQSGPSILPWWWWPCVGGMLLLAVAGAGGARSAGRCLRVSQELAEG